MAPSRRLTACSNSLSVWLEVFALCVTSASWPILKPLVFISICHPSSRPLLPTQDSESPLQATVPHYQIPFVPIIQEGEEPFSMFRDLTQVPTGDLIR